jgi:hypothetical protein
VELLRQRALVEALSGRKAPEQNLALQLANDLVRMRDGIPFHVGLLQSAAWRRRADPGGGIRHRG